MKKVLLVTIQNNLNFGNRLQNYALQTVLEKMGCSVVNLSLKDIPLAALSISQYQKVKLAVKKIAIHLGIKSLKPSVSMWTRKEKCISFSHKYIHNYMILTREQIEKEDFRTFDLAVTGSDQVWHNWKRIKDELLFYYLDFIDKNKRIAYAPSFGFKEFPSEDLETHKNKIMEMEALSCREKEGCELIYKLTGRKAQKVLDPTLLLSREEWEKIEEKPNFELPERFLIQFMLGKVSTEYKEEIGRIAEKRDEIIIDINDKNNLALYGISPNNFIWLIHHAETICTDSFHAAVFSILFKKNLRDFERVSPEFGDMFGRLFDLLESLGLERIIYSSREETDLKTILDEKGMQNLNDQIKRSVLYLKENLGCSIIE